jgi:hypothetical protein
MNLSTEISSYRTDLEDFHKTRRPRQWAKQRQSAGYQIICGRVTLTFDWWFSLVSGIILSLAVFILALWRMVEEAAGNVSVSKGLINREAEHNV